MARGSRTLRVLRWTGLAGCLLVLGVWGASLFWKAGLPVASIASGKLHIHWITDPPADKTRVYMFGEAEYYFCSVWDELLFETQTLAQLRSRLGFVAPRYQVIQAGPSWKTRPTKVNHLLVPLWLPLLLLAIPTALFWWRDGHNPPGLCQECGYDLTGNVSGRCPECGAQAHTATAPSKGGSPE